MAKDRVDKQTRRIEVLLDFRERALASGHSVPSTADMVRIAQTEEIWPSGIDTALAEPWRRTIEELLKQIHYGLADPIDTLSERLRRPSVEFVGSRDEHRETTPVRPGAGAVLAALRRWRTTSQGRSELQALKDNHLNNIARTGSRTTAEIARLLPREAAGLAREMSEVVANVLTGGAARPQDPAGPTPVLENAAPDDADAAPVAEVGPVAVPEVAQGAQGVSGAEDEIVAEDEATSSVRPARPLDADAEPAGGWGPATRHRRDPPVPPRSGPPDARAPGPSADPDGDERLKALDLADGDYAVEPPPFALRKRRLPTGGTALSWPSADGAPVILYRLVAVDDFHPSLRPQDALPITVTTGSVYADDRPFECAVRHLQVWCHRGTTEEEAAATPPVLHAGLLVVAPPWDAVVAQDGGQVSGRWKVFEGVERVAVTRYRQSEWRRHRQGAQPVHLEWGEGNLSGFVDDGVVRGERYVYEVATEVSVGEVRYLSDALDFDVLVPGVLAPVQDLRVVERGEWVDLSWHRPPAGEVRLYRTPNGPEAGATSRPLPVGDLEDRAGLSMGARLPVPDELGPDGRGVMRGVRFLPGLTRMYVTPVTVLDGQAWVGRTVSTVRLPRVEHGLIVERTHRQVMTFGWPPGADTVWVWVGPVEQSVETAMQASRAEEITREQYVRQGGLYFRYPLPPRGCAVHAAAAAYTGGRTVVGRPVTLRYPGLVRLRYTVGIARDKPGQRMRLTVQIFAEHDNPSAPPFVLVHNPERLPLHLYDGEPIYMLPVGDPAAVEGMQFRPSQLAAPPDAPSWTAEQPALTGYVRLFVCLEGDQLSQVALLDPPPASLRLDLPHRPRP